jgi:hypothetical protein
MHWSIQLQASFLVLQWVFCNSRNFIIYFPFSACRMGGRAFVDDTEIIKKAPAMLTLAKA